MPPPPLDSSDVAAFRRALQAGDHDTWRDFCVQIRPVLMAKAAQLLRAHHDRQDVVDATIADAWRHAARYATSLPPKPWILTILRRRAKDARRRVGEQKRSQLDPEIADTREHGPILEADRASIRALLDAALACLSERQRADVRLWGVCDGSTARIAELRGVGPRAVQREVQRAFGAIRDRPCGVRLLRWRDDVVEGRPPSAGTATVTPEH